MPSPGNRLRLVIIISILFICRGERKDISAYKNYLTSVSTITRNCMWWLHEVVPKLYKPDPMIYTSMLYKSLFMTQSHEEYFRFDGFPLTTPY